MCVNCIVTEILEVRSQDVNGGAASKLMAGVRHGAEGGVKYKVNSAPAARQQGG